MTERTFDAEEVVGHQGPIPGGRESDTLTHSEPGSMGGGVAGERLPAGGDRLSMDEETLKEMKKDGGGSDH
jgi:hypothetical protein